jgi:hypothetical protein
LQVRITTDTKTGRLYAGSTLPQGAVLLGMVERDNLEKGALVCERCFHVYLGNRLNAEKWVADLNA